MVAQINAEYRRYGLKRTLRRLASYALFEGRPHTTKGQWFNPVVFAILRTLSNLPGNPTVDRPIFITGLGRSGTTILGVLLSLHKNVGFLNEPKAIWSVVAPQHDVSADYHSSGGRFHLDASDATARTRLLATRLFSRYLTSTRASRVVDKYPEMIFRVDFLLDLFPDAKIVFIMRRGPDACQSIENWSQRLGTRQRGKIEDWWGRDDTKWIRLVDEIIASDPQYSSIKLIATPALDHANRAALEWIITMREGHKQLTLHPEAVIPIRYEDLTHDPENELVRLLSACGLSIDPDVLTYGKTQLYENAPKPWPRLLPKIDALFTETMCLLGYPTDHQDNTQQ